MAKATGITLSKNRDEPAFGLQVETESNGSIYVLTTHILHCMAQKS